MKKSLLSFILSVLTFHLFSQDYRLIQKEKESLFVDDYNLVKVIRIDSFSVSGNDTTFYNYKAFREMMNSGCVMVKHDSWLGKKIISKPGGEYLFYNDSNQVIRFLSKALLNQTWTMYTYSNGDYIEAKITGVGKENFLSVSDSVKTVTLQAKNASGTNISNFFNQKLFKISKGHGLISGFSMLEFPYPSVGLSLCGQTNPSIGVQNINAKEIFNYEVGDVFHTATVITNFPDYADEYFTYKKVLFKSTSLNLDTITYIDSVIKIKKHYQWSPSNSSYTTLVYNALKEEKIILSEHAYYLNKLPLEAYSPEESSQTSQLFLSSLPTAIGKTIFAGYNFSGDSCWSYFIGTSYESYYYNGLGGPYYYYQPVNSPAYDYHTLEYFEKSSGTWGTPIDFDSLLATSIQKNEFKLATAFVYPNPMDNETVFETGLSDVDSDLIVYNLLGEIVRTESFKEKLTFKRDALTSGVYLYKIISKNNLVSSGKLILN